jgi:hypothetical protein
MAGIDVVLATVASWLLSAGIAGRAGLFRRLVADGNRVGMLWCYILTGKDQDGKFMAPNVPAARSVIPESLVARDNIAGAYPVSRR